MTKKSKLVNLSQRRKGDEKVAETKPSKSEEIEEKTKRLVLLSKLVEFSLHARSPRGQERAMEAALS